MRKGILELIETANAKPQKHTHIVNVIGGNIYLKTGSHKGVALIKYFLSGIRLLRANLDFVINE